MRRVDAGSELPKEKGPLPIHTYEPSPAVDINVHLYLAMANESNKSQIPRCRILPDSAARYLV
jgi:hypothetical protein